MTILQFNSRSERERESSLSSSSSIKNSFTLIELSIVLLILSLLVGSLLVGRQIVDRAKIQRIIFEFDYYEKAFHQFYDTYRYVPGALPYKECIKHAEFSGCTCNSRSCFVTKDGCDVKEDVVTWCQHHTNSRTISAKVINNTQRSKHSNMIQLKKAGLISQDAYPFNGGNVLTDSQQPATLTTTSSSGDGFAGISSWNENGRLNFRGWLKNDTPEIAYTSYRNKFVDKNYIITYVTYENQARAGWVTSDRRGSFVSAKMASELDAKVDDGRPGTGRIIGIKAGLSVPKESNKPRQGTEDEQKQVCFDQLDTSVEDINKAIYHSSTDLKYGCNIIKVMEDVK